MRSGRAPRPRTVRELCSRHPDGEIPDLAVVRPSLEDVYLAMLEAADGPDDADEDDA